MPVQVSVDNPFTAFGDPAATLDFQLYGAGEIPAIAAEAAAAGEQVLVFVTRRTTATYIAARLRGLRVAELTGAVDMDSRQQLVDDIHAGRYDVIVATDAFATGWKAPAICTRVLHVELPLVGDHFVATMLQREMRIRRLPDDQPAAASKS